MVQYLSYECSGFSSAGRFSGMVFGVSPGYCHRTPPSRLGFIGGRSTSCQFRSFKHKSLAKARFSRVSSRPQDALCSSSDIPFAGPSAKRLLLVPTQRLQLYTVSQAACLLKECLTQIYRHHDRDLSTQLLVHLLRHHRLPLPCPGRHPLLPLPPATQLASAPPPAMVPRARGPLLPLRLPAARTREPEARCAPAPAHS